MKFCTSAFFGFLFLSSTSLFAQLQDPGFENPEGNYLVPVSGPSSVQVGETKRYYLNSLIQPYTYSWYATRGTVGLQSTTDVNITWNSDGLSYVEYEASDFGNYYYGRLNVTVGSGVPPTPNATFSYDYNCGNTIVTRSFLSLSANYEWYWQTSPTGTSTMAIDKEETNTITVPTEMYLRAKSKNSSLWSSAQSVGTVNVFSSVPPAPPSSGEKRIGAGNIALETMTMINVDEYVWYNSNQAIIATTTSPSYTRYVSSPTSFYVAARNACGTGVKTEIPILVAPQPTITATENSSAFKTTYQLSLNFTYDTESWKGSDGSPIAAGATVKEPGIYRVDVTYGSASAYAEYEIKTINNYNYILVENILKSGVHNESDINSLDERYLRRSIQYFDGLGRFIQKVDQKASPGGFDLVQPIDYDDYGRENIKYLPFVLGSNGHYKPDVIDNSGNYIGSPHHIFYDEANTTIARDAKPYSVTIFEPSPLNRIMKQGAPGSVWQPNETTGVTDENDHSVKFSYDINTTEDEVHKWQVNDAGNPYYKQDYLSGELNKNITYNEKGDLVIRFVDKLGQAVLKRVQAVENPNMAEIISGNWADTYYIYDDFQRLRVVIPPTGGETFATSKVPTGYTLLTTDAEITTSTGHYMYLPDVTVTISPTITLNHELIIKPYTVTRELLNDWVFRYDYDGRGRMVMKKVPGADSVLMVYDDRDRLVLTQDGNQRTRNEWLFTKYDAFNRLVSTGVYTDNSNTNRQAMQSAVNEFYENLGAGKAWYESRGSIIHGYSNASFPQESSLTAYNRIMYYDNYDFTSVGFSLPAGIFTAPSTDNKEMPSENDAVKGQVTGTKIKVLGTSHYITTVNFYDDKYRLIQSHVTNPYQHITDIITTQYDFTDQVRRTHQSHTQNTQKYTVEKKYEYDHEGRLKEVYHKTDDNLSFVLLVQNEYNELGELIEKRLHSEDNTDFSQNVDYRYNIRGWLTNINDSQLSDVEEDDYFGMELGYNTSLGLNSTGQFFNGNISSVKWKSFNSENEKGYSYDYDPLNRITSGIHQVKTAGWLSQEEFSLKGIKYDLNGNIKNLQRPTSTAAYMDNLTYNYTGNQLNYVMDTGDKMVGFKDGSNWGNDYAYDKNSNMVKDLNKEISSITYNHLNLPTKVIKDANNHIEYTYDAAGIKLSQTVHEEGKPPKTIHYASEFIYEQEESGALQLQFIQHEEGRIVNDVLNGWEYQYHLKDHLGNTRVSFTTKPKVIPYKIDFESTTEGDILFAQVDTNTIVPNDIFDHTDVNGTTYTKTQMLDGTEGRRVGTVLAIPMGKGDTIDAKVYAKYVELTSTSTSAVTSVASALVGAFTGSSTVASTEAGTTTINNSFNNGSLIGGTGFPVEDGSAPMAFLSVMFLPEGDDINLVKDASFAYDQIDAESVQQIGQPKNQNFDELRVDGFISPGQGYVLIYVSNESNNVVEVYFDDMEVSVKQHPVIQTDNYYPFGLTFNSYQRVTAKENRWKFTGKERITDLGLNLDDFGARMYDPALARWNKIDPASEEYFSISPYTYALNTPINAIDPDGKRVYFVAGAGNDQIGWNYTAKWKRAFDNGGIQGFTRLNASHGTTGDIAFTAMYRDNGYSNNMEGRHGVLELRQDLQIDKAVNDIKDDLSNNPLAEGEQLNLAGYSYGSVLQAHAALKLAKDQYIDNLILVGSPISSKSRLFKQLQRNKNIGNVIRIDIEKDKLSDPADILEFIEGGNQNADPNNVGEGPHFDLARPGEGEGEQNDTYQHIKSVVVEYLKKQGVK